MAKALWQQFIVNDMGDVLVGASVEIRRESDNALATCWEDRAGTITKPNPLTADNAGYVFAYLDDDAYKITATFGIDTYIFRYVGVSLSQEQPPGAHDFSELPVPTSDVIGSPTELLDLRSYLSHLQSAGVTHGCALTDNGNGTVAMSAGTALLRPSSDPSAHATLYLAAIPATPSLVLTDNATNYIGVSYNAGSPIVVASTTFATFNCLDVCISHVVHRSGTTLNIIDAREQNVDTGRKIRRLFYAFSKFIHAEGGSRLGASALALTVTTGTFYFMIQELPHPAFDTSVAGTANENVFRLWYRDGVGGWTSIADSKVINTTVYDNNTGTPVTIDNNKYGISWVYIVHDSPSKLHVVMGQAQYADAASASVAAPPTSIPDLINGSGTLIGFVVYVKSGTSFTNVYSAFSTIFSAGAATQHNGLSGLQGGAINEYFHLTSAQHTYLTVDLDKKIRHFYFMGVN